MFVRTQEYRHFFVNDLGSSEIATCRAELCSDKIGCAIKP